MKKSFTEPSLEVVLFGNNVISTSECGCFDGVTDWGSDEYCGSDQNCPNLNDPNCGCKLNVTNPDLGNCIKP